MYDMKSMKIAGLCLVAMFVMSMVATATASAAGPVWEQCTTEQETGLTKWKDSKCTEASATGAWNWKEIKNTEKVESNGTLELKDTATLLGESAVICTGTNSGSIGPGKFDRVESITAKTCTAVHVCESSPAPTAKPIGLPWQTELYETENKIRNKITSVSGKEVGWEVICKAEIIGTTTDVCTSVAAGPEVTNKQAVGNVQVTFNESAGSASCTKGSSTSGKVKGAIQIFTAAYAIRVQ